MIFFGILYLQYSYYICLYFKMCNIYYNSMDYIMPLSYILIIFGQCLYYILIVSYYDILYQYKLFGLCYFTNYITSFC